MDRIVSGVRWNRVNRHFNVIALTGANLCIINWVVRALNADSLTAVVHYIRPYTRGMTKHLFSPSNYIGNQFIIEIGHLRVFVVNATLRWPKNSPKPWYIGHIPHLLGPYCLNIGGW
jgi:hypothetical protein